MLLLEDREIDFFVGSKIGSFKHIKYHTDATKNNKKCIENLVEIKDLQKDDAITCMVWGNAEQTEILLARKNQQIQVFNTLDGFTKTYTADFGTGDVVGLGRYKRRLIAGLASGLVQVWSKKENTIINTGGKLDRMRVCAEDNTLFATGGEENELKVWKVGETVPVFTAKNLPHDSLQLRRPVWVSDLTFLSDTLLAVCSRHGYVRLYDTRAQRRPVVNVEFKMAATCLTPSFEERQVIVGFGRGQLQCVDLRRGRPDRVYKGAVGAVTGVVAERRARVLVSASLDRHLRVHNYDTKELLYKQYLTSKLTGVLVQSESSTPLHRAAEVKAEEGAEAGAGVEAGGDELDRLFDDMEAIGEKTSKKRRALDEVDRKRMKPSTGGSTDADLDGTRPDAASEDDAPPDAASDGNTPEDAIVQLLRSTERTKKKREKLKREKKAKSVFHNV
ncbi:WD repeat-containing protein 74-like [Aricia agestis]|uniref:WD repeat-containing protein 74-like n=1 Tax=Aricia agestis TaxID=91739 RepID=UPI001C208E03|nr:WD repeat-containing protein 74-like [Aricia agestis]